MLAENTGEKQPARGPGRRFAKGESGNPAGRPKGARNRATRAAEDLLEGEAEAVTRKAVELTTSQAAELGRLVESYVRAIETAELEARIEALERDVRP